MTGTLSTNSATIGSMPRRSSGSAIAIEPRKPPTCSMVVASAAWPTGMLALDSRVGIQLTRKK